MMKWKMEKYGPDMLKAWGYDVTPYVEPSGWSQIVQLQNSGKLKEAWQVTKEFSEFLEKMEKEPFLKEYWNMNEAGNYQEAFVSNL